VVLMDLKAEYPHHVELHDHAIPAVTLRRCRGGETDGARWLLDRGAREGIDWDELRGSPLILVFKDPQLALEFKLRWC
jgi:hypothetical protein